LIGFKARHLSSRCGLAIPSYHISGQMSTCLHRAAVNRRRWEAQNRRGTAPSTGSSGRCDRAGLPDYFLNLHIGGGLGRGWSWRDRRESTLLHPLPAREGNSPPHLPRCDRGCSQAAASPPKNSPLCQAWTTLASPQVWLAGHKAPDGNRPRSPAARSACWRRWPDLAHPPRAPARFAGQWGKSHRNRH